MMRFGQESGREACWAGAVHASADKEKAASRIARCPCTHSQATWLGPRDCAGHFGSGDDLDWLSPPAMRMPAGTGCEAVGGRVRRLAFTPKAATKFPDVALHGTPWTAMHMRAPSLAFCKAQNGLDFGF